MLRITKLADYAVLILAVMAKQPEHIFTTTELTKRVHLGQPTVSKLLKILTKKSICQSFRGVEGGYSLKALPSATSLLDVVQAIEGPLALTECQIGECQQRSVCETRHHWIKINHVVAEALARVSLVDMMQSSPNAGSERSDITEAIE